MSDDISELAITDDNELLLKINLSEEQLKRILAAYDGKEHSSDLIVFSDGAIVVCIEPKGKYD